ncbi:DUF3130 family protein [Listeria booriae]|uniref:DUF3130 family protein n=1 Tax=Listeria booriae TaxID=1552123 RepID=A0A842F7V3_9LIST|nr:DUF3130 family protein [Listeria booriae]MBC2240041.1 DUF3130 family protein [Listeria booriae]
MVKKIQLPSGRLAEHANVIQATTNTLKLQPKPNVSYSTGSAQQLVKCAMAFAQMTTSMPTAFQKDTANLKQVEKAFVASEKALGDRLHQGIAWMEHKNK